MSVWYFNKMWSVSRACAASTDSTPSTTRVRAQSSVSDTEGALRSSRVRKDRTMRATWSASSWEMPGTRVATMSRSRSRSG